MRAFVLGNGPSLRDMPLDCLTGDVTFACNRINLMWEKTHPGLLWRPTYYLGMDWTGKKMMEDVAVNVEAAKHSFIRGDRCSDIEQKRRRFEWPSRITYFWPLCTHLGLLIDDDPARQKRLPLEWHLPNICGFGSTVHMAVQMAVLMGHDPIYLLGCDLGYRNFPEGTPDPNHFDPEYVGYDDWGWDAKDATLLFAHMLMEQETRKIGVEIINLTPNVALDSIHRRLALDEVL